MKKNQYSDLIDSVVFCRWIDITSYDIQDIDIWLKRVGELSSQSIIFITLGKVLAADQDIVLIAPTLAEKNENIKQRKANDAVSIPTGCILEMKELEFKADTKYAFDVLEGTVDG